MKIDIDASRQNQAQKIAQSGGRVPGSLAEANTKKDADDAEATIRAALFKTKYGGQTKDMGFSKYVDESYLPASEIKKASY